MSTELHYTDLSLGAFVSLVVAAVLGALLRARECCLACNWSLVRIQSSDWSILTRSAVSQDPLVILGQDIVTCIQQRHVFSLLSLNKPATLT